MSYKDLSFKDLRAECKYRELKASGNTAALIDRLTNDDLGHAPEPPAPKKPTSNLHATDSNPNNPNYDMAGRWLRRKGLIQPDGREATAQGRWHKPE